MERNIYILNAWQIVTSAQHEEGVYSLVPDFPQTIDSRNYGGGESNPNGNSDTALIVAQAGFSDEVKALTLANNANRVMWTVTLTRADGTLLAHRSWGKMPDMTPQPEPPVNEGE